MNNWGDKMLTAEFEHNLNQNMMILYQNEQDLKEDEEFQAEMLIGNKICGLLPVSRKIFNNQVQYCYEISGMQSLSAVIEHDKMNKKELFLLFHTFFECMKSITAYLLDESGMLLNPDWIFIHLPSYEIRFCYYPGYKETLNIQLNRLIEYLMNHINYQDQETVIYLYRLYMVNKNANSTLHDLEVSLKDPLEEVTEDENSIKEIEKNSQEQEIESDFKVYKNRIIADQKDKSQKNTACEDIRNREKTYKDLTALQKRQEISLNVPAKKKLIDLGMKEKNKEKQQYIYPVSCYILEGIIFLVSLLLVAGIFQSGLLVQTFGSNLDPVKTAIFLIIIFIVNIFIFKIIFQKTHSKGIKNMIKKDNFGNKDKTNNWSDLKSESGVIYGLFNKISDKTEKVQSVLFNKEPKSYTDYNTVKNERIARYTKEQNIQRNEKQTQVEENNPTGQFSDVTEDENEETIVLFNQQDICSSEIELEDEWISLELVPQQQEIYQKIVISELPFYIGKLKTRTDICIPSPTISRIHSKIVLEGHKLILYDMNSTNGTFVNGCRLSVNGGKEIETGDRISFADVSFQVELTRKSKACCSPSNMVQFNRQEFFEG